MRCLHGVDENKSDHANEILGDVTVFHKTTLRKSTVFLADRKYFQI